MSTLKPSCQGYKSSLRPRPPGQGQAAHFKERARDCSLSCDYNYTQCTIPRAHSSHNRADLGSGDSGHALLTHFNLCSGWSHNGSGCRCGRMESNHLRDCAAATLTCLSMARALRLCHVLLSAPAAPRLAHCRGAACRASTSWRCSL